MKEYLNINRLNNEGFAYLREVFPDYEGDDFDSLYAYLSYKEDLEIILEDYSYISEFSSSIISLMNDVNDDYCNLTLSYGKKETVKQKTVILDMKLLNKKGHVYLKKVFDLPEYYGENLDALYDCLSELDDTRIIITNMDKVNRKSLKILEVINEVADEYENLTISEEVD